MRETILLLGGARSGKSAFAEQLAGKKSERVLYVATAEAGDDEMEKRIAIHRASRPSTWNTLEAPLKAGKCIEDVYSGEDVVIIDCITLLVSNIILQDKEDMDSVSLDDIERAVNDEIASLLKCMGRVESGFIVVSNEVGLGLVPDNKLARIYRDVLGRANQRLAAYCDTVYLMVAGIPVVVKQNGN